MLKTTHKTSKPKRNGQNGHNGKQKKADYKVADIGLAEWGRKEIRLAKQQRQQARRERRAAQAKAKAEAAGEVPDDGEAIMRLARDAGVRLAGFVTVWGRPSRPMRSGRREGGPWAFPGPLARTGP